MCARAHVLAFAVVCVGVHTKPYTNTSPLYRDADALVSACLAQKINIRKIDANSVSVTFDETTVPAHVEELVAIFGGVTGKSIPFCAKSVADEMGSEKLGVSSKFARTSEYMTHPVFHMYHSETDMLR